MVSVASCPTLLVLVGSASSSSLRDDGLAADVRDVDHRARAGHGNRFFDAADAHVGVDVRGEPGAQHDPFADDRVEPGQREGDRVDAGPQLGDGVAPLAVGDRDALLFDEDRAGGCDGDARQDGAGGVADDAGDAGVLRPGGRGGTRTR